LGYFHTDTEAPMHLPFLKHVPAHGSWLDSTAGLFNQWREAWQVQHPQHTSARRLSEVGPYLLSDVGCPANQKEDLHAIRRELRQSCADVSVH
jgi:hypothetical protein